MTMTVGHLTSPDVDPADRTGLVDLVERIRACTSGTADPR